MNAPSLHLVPACKPFLLSVDCGEERPPVPSKANGYRLTSEVRTTVTIAKTEPPRELVPVLVPKWFPLGSQRPLPREPGHPWPGLPVGPFRGRRGPADPSRRGALCNRSVVRFCRKKTEALRVVAYVNAVTELAGATVTQTGLAARFSHAGDRCASKRTGRKANGLASVCSLHAPPTPTRFRTVETTGCGLSRDRISGFEIVTAGEKSRGFAPVTAPKFAARPRARHAPLAPDHELAEDEDRRAFRDVARRSLEVLSAHAEPTAGEDPDDLDLEADDDL